MEDTQPIKTRRKCLGITLKKGARVYSYELDKEFLLEKDFYVPEKGIQEHIGHIRFDSKILGETTRKRYALDYEGNRFKYTWDMQ